MPKPRVVSRKRPASTPPVVTPASSPEPSAAAALEPASPDPAPSGGGAVTPPPDAGPKPVVDWVLATQYWPPGMEAVEVSIWVTAEGQIAFFQIEGEAAQNADVQSMFANFGHTPMRPGEKAGVPVPGFMRIQIWPGDGPPPERMPAASEPPPRD